MANIITHKGVVENINGSHIRVRIMQTSACSTCNAKGFCCSADSKEKVIDIYDSLQVYKTGDEVLIYGAMSIGMKAVLVAFILPFIILISMLFIMMLISENDELLSALVSILTLAPYYLVVYLFRNKLKKKLSFTLKPIK